MVLAWLAAAWLAGVASAAMLGRGAWPLAIAVAAGALACALARPSRPTLALALAIPMVFGGALLRFEQARAAPAANAASRFNDGVAMRLRGVVEGEPQIGDTSQQATVSVRSMQFDGAWRDASGRVLARLPLLPAVSSGEVLEL